MSLLRVPTYSSRIFDLAYEWFSKFAVLFLIGGNPISGSYKFLASEWGKSQQWS